MMARYSGSAAMQRAALLFRGDVCPHELLQLSRVVRHDDLAGEGAVLELRTKLHGVGDVHVVASDERPDALRLEGNGDGLALDHH